MKKFLFFAIALNLIVGFGYLNCGATEPVQDGAPIQDTQQAEIVQPSSLWIVVNMFTGRTSKQAVIVQETLERLGAEGRGTILPYAEITVENMKKLRPSFLALSPNGIPWCKYRGKNGQDLDHFFKALRVIVDDMQIPVVGICGGHQALALAFGGKVGPIRGGEDDCFPYGHNPTEKGRRDVYVLQRDPLFLGMGKSLNLVESHYDEVKRLPKGFIALAENKLCPYQIIRHPSRPAYGVQAHTEYYMNSRPDGGILLRNFLDIVRIHNRIVRNPNVTSTPVSQATERGAAKTKKIMW
ncbi:MAG: gamma-glutamyl-gamma-aminobutyrate hydrolase family protein [Deltaproteobacteria bacterium]|nr:gamma-glutamyl-gamma-aminobutyrate hydrolase family protein [Deltaproteobacteria bacterium]